MEKTTERKTYIDIIKGVAIFCVVMVHVLISTECRYTTGFDIAIISIYMTMARICVPLFFMATGALMLSVKKELQIKKLYTKNILRILLLPFFCGFIYKSLRIFLGMKTFDGFGHYMTDTIIEFLSGSLEFHYWYIYAIVCIYIMLPVLKSFVNHADKKMIEYYLCIWFVGNILYFAARYIHAISAITDEFRFLGGFFGYIGYVILGYYLDTYKGNRRIYVGGIVSFLCSMGGFVFLREISTIDGSIFLGYYTPWVILYSAAVFLLIKTITERRDKTSAIGKICSWFGKRSFGIYILHMIFVILFLDADIWTIHISAVIDVIIYGVVILLITGGMVFVLQKIPFIKKWI